MKHGIYKTVSRVNSILQKIEMIIGCVLLAVLFVVMISNALGRYLFKSAILWSDELNGFLFVWFSFLCSSYIMGSDQHIRVNIVMNFLPKKVKYVLKTVLNVIMIVFLLMCISPLLKCMSVMTYSGIMRLPLEYVYAIMPISFVLMAVHIIHNIICNTYECFWPEVVSEEGV